MNRKLKLFFTISVLVNLLLIGALAGMVAQCHHRGPEADMAKLSPAGKTLMEQTFEKSHAAMEDTFKSARAARADVIATLEADTFDRAAFLKSSDKLRDVQIDIMKHRTETAADLAGQLSATDRRTMAEWLAGPGGKPPEHGPDGSHGWKPPEAPVAKP